MAATHTLTLTYNDGTGAPIQKTITRTADGQPYWSGQVATGQTAYHVICPIDKDTTTLLLISSDRNVTIKTNNSGAPDDTLTIVANEPAIFYSNSELTMFLSVDVTDLYIANSSGATANIEIRGIADISP